MLNAPDCSRIRIVAWRVKIVAFVSMCEVVSVLIEVEEVAGIKVVELFVVVNFSASQVSHSAGHCSCMTTPTFPDAKHNVSEISLHCVGSRLPIQRPAVVVVV
jgi:hypothetical protein